MDKLLEVGGELLEKVTCFCFVLDCWLMLSQIQYK